MAEKTPIIRGSDEPREALHAYRSILDCPGPVDLAFAVVPAPAILPAARECARKGVRGLVVISAGFAESDEAGHRRQQELVDVCLEAGMRLIGPNCMGMCRYSGKMISSLKTFPLLCGYRGGPRHDVTALEQVILRVGALVEDIPEIAELDLNRLIVLPDGQGICLADARVRVAQTVPPLRSGGHETLTMMRVS